MSEAKNKELIFKFMGKEYGEWEFQNRTQWISLRPQPKGTFDAFKSYELLPYDSDWNYLMGVVEKIESITLTFGKTITTTWVHILGQGCIVEHGSAEFAFCSEHDKPMTKIQSTYLAVINFIKFFNKLENVEYLIVN